MHRIPTSTITIIDCVGVKPNLASGKKCERRLTMKTIKQVRGSYYIANDSPADVTKNHGWETGGWQMAGFGSRRANQDGTRSGVQMRL